MAKSGPLNLLLHLSENPIYVFPAQWFGGEGHTRWRERGWESLNSDEGTYNVVLYINMYFVIPSNETSWPRSQFLHSCIGERFLYSQDKEDRNI